MSKIKEARILNKKEISLVTGGRSTQVTNLKLEELGLIMHRNYDMKLLTSGGPVKRPPN
jgi:hypothetical protein